MNKELVVRQASIFPSSKIKGDCMQNRNFFDRITVDPNVMVGKPTIREMRITVEQILKALAGGRTMKDLLVDYPELEEEDIKVALLYASELVGEERVFAVGN
jgi:uncharacterized protein (DUF433 family)